MKEVYYDLVLTRLWVYRNIDLGKQLCEFSTWKSIWEKGFHIREYAGDIYVMPMICWSIPNVWQKINKDEMTKLIERDTEVHQKAIEALKTKIDEDDLDEIRFTGGTVSKDIREIVLNAISKQADIHMDSIGENMNLRDDLLLDSLDFMGVLSLIEVELDILIADADAYKMKVVGDLIGHVGSLVGRNVAA